jgi:hypothetical protein
MIDELVNISEEHKKILLYKIASLFENDPLIRKSKIKKIFQEDGLRLID